MKKMILGLCALVLLGGGCATTPSVVEGNWYLAFDMPNEWVMVPDYTAGNVAFPSQEDVDREMSDVVLQSVGKTIWTNSGRVPSEEEIAIMGEYVTEDYSIIRVLRLDTRRVVPSESEDLGNGFFKLKLCEDGEDCQAGGRYNYDYYLVTEAGNKYQFMITAYGQDVDTAEEIILSAQEVTIE